MRHGNFRVGDLQNVLPPGLSLSPKFERMLNRSIVRLENLDDPVYEKKFLFNEERFERFKKTGQWEKEKETGAIDFEEVLFSERETLNMFGGSAFENAVGKNKTQKKEKKQNTSRRDKIDELKTVKVNDQFVDIAGKKR